MPTSVYLAAGAFVVGGAVGGVVGWAWTTHRLIVKMRMLMKESPAALNTPGAVVESEVSGRHVKPTK